MAGTKSRLFVIILTIMMIVSAVIIGGSRSVLDGNVNGHNRYIYPVAYYAARICDIDS